MERYMVTIEGHNFTDVEEIELPKLPADGDLMETKYGTCIVVSTERLPDSDGFNGKIACRMP